MLVQNVTNLALILTLNSLFLFENNIPNATNNLLQDCEIIDINITDISCFDNNTPNDPTDDRLRFTINPVTTCSSIGYKLTSDDIEPNEGLYGVETTFTLPEGTSDTTAATFIIIQDFECAASFEIFFVGPQPNCSFDCTNSSPNTGIGKDTLLCRIGVVLNLHDFIEGETNDGFWFVNGTYQVSNEFYIGAATPLINQFSYKKGIGTICETSTDFEIRSLENLTVTSSFLEACGYAILPPIEGNFIDGNEVYSTDIFGTGQQYLPGDTIYNSQILTIYDIFDECQATGQMDIFIHQLDLDFPSEITACKFYEFLGWNNSSTYDISYHSGSDQSGEELIFGDTIFQSMDIFATIIDDIECTYELKIPIKIDQDQEHIINDILCEGEEIVINNTIYNQSNLTGTEILPTISGCDSTIILDLILGEAQYQYFEETYCYEDVVTINENTYTANNPSDSISLENFASNGCDSSILIDLHFIEPIITYIDSTLCNYETLTIGDFSFNNSNPTGTVILPNASLLGCDSIIEVNLEFDALEWDFTLETLNDLKTQQILLEFNGLYNAINWESNDFLSCLNCPDPTVDILFNETFTAEVEYGNNCLLDLEINMLSLYEFKYYIPNAFSPNGDGINEYLFIQGIDGTGIIDLFEIYDRWGNKVYHLSSPQQINQMEAGWNGRINNKKAAPGVYVYIAQVIDPRGEKHVFQGNLTLLK